MRKSELKIKDVLERIEALENAIEKAHEYLETGAHTDWHRFRPLFVDKIRDGEVLPPHKDWVRNVFIPRHERAIKRLEKRLDSLERKK